MGTTLHSAGMCFFSVLLQEATMEKCPLARRSNILSETVSRLYEILGRVLRFGLYLGHYVELMINTTYRTLGTILELGQYKTVLLGY